MKWHRIRQAMHANSISRRALATRLGITEGQVDELIDPDGDLTLSQLVAIRDALGLPLVELLDLPFAPYESPIGERAAMVRVMKGIKALAELDPTPQQAIVIDNAVAELTRLMPELAHVSAYQSVGQRRTTDELSPREERPVDTFGEELAWAEDSHFRGGGAC